MPTPTPTRTPNRDGSPTTKARVAEIDRSLAEHDREPPDPGEQLPRTAFGRVRRRSVSGRELARLRRRYEATQNRVARQHAKISRLQAILDNEHRELEKRQATANRAEQHYYEADETYDAETGDY